MTSLRECQFGVLKQMLTYNEFPNKGIAKESTLKILICDEYGQNIISSHVTTEELKQLGVTLLVLHSARDAIPEVPAVYFCASQKENIRRICRDFDKQLYSFYYLNFISTITGQCLEDLIVSGIPSESTVKIHKVDTQNVNFICLEDNLFISEYRQADYDALNEVDLPHNLKEVYVRNIVESLFSVFVTLGHVPIIRSSKGDAAELVAEKLNDKLRENLEDTTKNLFHGKSAEGDFSLSRPMLILLDRNIDIVTPLHHSWTYQALAHDVLDLETNRVKIPECFNTAVSSDHKIKTRVYDLDFNDPFWIEHKNSSFPTVVKAIQEDLDKYRCLEAEVKDFKRSMGLDADSDLALSLVSDNTQRLTSAVNSLPQLMEKKRLIDLHTTIATAILNAIKSRRLDSFFELEEKIMSQSSSVESKAVMDLIADPSAGTKEDKMRLFIIYYLCTSQLPDDEYKKFESALRAAKCNLSPMIYLKRLKGLKEMSIQYEGGGTEAIPMFSKLESPCSTFDMEGVKNLVVQEHKLPVSRTVEAVLSGGEANAEFTWMDPRWSRTDSEASARAARHPPPTNVVVFLVGGGNYVEYHNLIDFAKQQTASGAPIKITYGSSTFYNGSEFLKDLCDLGDGVVYCELFGPWHSF